MITYQDIMDRLGVTIMQIEMVMYSGALPNDWADEEKMEFYLQVWEDRIKRRNKNATHTGVRTL